MRRTLVRLDLLPQKRDVRLRSPAALASIHAAVRSHAPRVVAAARLDLLAEIFQLLPQIFDLLQAGLVHHGGKHRVFGGDGVAEAPSELDRLRVKMVKRRVARVDDVQTRDHHQLVSKGHTRLLDRVISGEDTSIQS